MSLCYAVAWLFHFKMSPNTAMKGQQLRNGYIFSPVQSSFEISLRKASSTDCRGLLRTQPTPVKAGVILRCCELPHPFSLHITCQKRGRNIISYHSKKKQYITPFPHPLHSLELVTPRSNMITAAHSLTSSTQIVYAITFSFFIRFV